MRNGFIPRHGGYKKLLSYQNIIEGSMASATSKETEIKLTNVARASLEELLADYRDFLRVRGYHGFAGTLCPFSGVRTLRAIRRSRRLRAGGSVVPRRLRAHVRAHRKIRPSAAPGDALTSNLMASKASACERR